MRVGLSGSDQADSSTSVVAPNIKSVSVDYTKTSKSFEQNGKWVANGKYVIASLGIDDVVLGTLKGKVGSVNSVSGKSASKLNKWVFKFDNSTKSYTIVNAKTKRALTYVPAGKKVKLTKLGKKTSKKQRWILKSTKNGYMLKSYANPAYAVSATNASSVLKAKTSSVKDGTIYFNLISASTYNPSSIIQDGVYAFSNYSNSDLLQIKYAKNAPANTQKLTIGADSGDITQKFEVKRIGKSGNIYRIYSAATGRLLSDIGAGRVVQAKVHLGDLKQRWRAVQSKGGIVFQNVKTKGYMTFSSSNGGEVATTTSTSDDASSHWLLVPSHTGLNSYQTLGLSKANNPKKTNITKTNYFLTIDKTAHHLIIWNRENKWSVWKILKDWRCTTSAHGGPYDKNYYRLTAKAKYARQDHIIEVNDYRYGAKYWSSLGNGTYIHSTLFQYQSNAGKDGRLGMSLSGGCTRLAVANAKWVYDNLPYNTGYAMYYK